MTKPDNNILQDRPLEEITKEIQELYASITVSAEWFLEHWNRIQDKQLKIQIGNMLAEMGYPGFKRKIDLVELGLVKPPEKFVRRTER